MTTLHPEAAALLQLMIERQVPAVHTLDAPTARRFYLERRVFTQPEPPEVAAVRNVHAGDIPVRLYRPIGTGADAVLPVLVYLHGGGWVIGDIDTHDVMCRTLANTAGIVVVSVHYRLAPEHRFPAAVDDTIAAVRWVRSSAGELRIDARRIAVGGDSAGGNLAAVAAIVERDAGTPLAYQLLIYPATDQRRGHASHTINGQGYLLTRESMDYYHGHYFGGSKAHDTDWRASPLLAPDHSRLPPALVITAGFDPLRDEGAEYAEKLAAAGVPTSHVCFERQVHGFITMGKVLGEANTALALAGAELRRVLHPGR